MSDMNHLDDQRLGRYLDGELSDVERSRVERHLDDCDRCRSEVAHLKRTSDRLNALIEKVELPERLRKADVVPRQESERGGAGSRSLSLRAGAAAAVLLLAASAAVPGSPVRSWLVDAVHRVQATLVAEEELANGPESAFGLQVRPADGRVAVRIRGAAPGTRVAVRLVEDNLAGAWAPGARLRSEAGRLEVIDPERGEVRIDVPRGVRRASVTAGSRTIFRWTHGRAVVHGTAPNSADSVYRFQLGSERDR